MSLTSLLENRYAEILQKFESKEKLTSNEKGIINKHLKQKGEKICFSCYQKKNLDDFNKQMSKCIDCIKDKHPLMAFTASELYELVIQGELDHVTLYSTYKRKIVDFLKSSGDSHCFTCNRTKSLNDFTKIKSKTKCDHCKSDYDKNYHSARGRGHDKRTVSKKDMMIRTLSLRLAGHNRRAKELGLIYGAGKIEAIALVNHFVSSNGETIHCAYCNETSSDIEDFHIEHIVPLSLEVKGNTGDNITIACKRCNFIKRDLTFKEWMGHIEKIIGREVVRKKFDRLETYLRTYNVDLFDMEI